MKEQKNTVLAVAILASFVAFLDGSIVNVALPAIMHNFHGGLALQQWVVDAYLITLGALILIAGSLSDLFGRTRIMRYGLFGFGITSLLCALAPSGNFLIIARALQGVSGALLVPSSLALIMSVFEGKEQGKAVGSWTAWTGMAFLFGPLLSGLLVDIGSWRYIFAINVIPIAVTLYLLNQLKEVEPAPGGAKVDVSGAILSAMSLGGGVYALIEHDHYGWGNPIILASLAAGFLSLCYFLWHEYQTKHPMMPLGLFKIRNFGWGNVATLFIYAALSIATFLIVIFVQQNAGYSALKAGFSLLPVTILMFVLSSRFGVLSGKYGPRIFMTIGPIIGGLGFLWMLHTQDDLNYWSQLLPGVVIFGLGLSITVSPLTAAILGAVDARRSGIASAINNAVARIAGLVGIACISLFAPGKLDLAAFHSGLVVMAVLLFIGGFTSLIGIRNSS